MNLYPKTTVLRDFSEMESFYSHQDTASKGSDENSSYVDFNYTYDGCPVGEPYPWIFEIPRIFTQNVTAPINSIPLEEVVLKVISYTITIIAALVSLNYSICVRNSSGTILLILYTE